MTTNLRSTIIIKIQNIKIKFEDIKPHQSGTFQIEIVTKNLRKLPHIFVEACLSEALGSLSVMSSLLRRVL